MAVREGLLVLLAAGPSHGYQLKLDFERATGEAWSLNVGQVYSTLQRLERDELVEVVGEDDEGRIVHRLTLAGRDEVDAWLVGPVSRTVTNRDELSMKLLLAIAAGTGDPHRIIAIQRQSTMGDLQDYTRLRADTDPDDLAWSLHLDRLAIRSEAELRWLDRVERRLEGRPPPDRAGTGARSGARTGARPVDGSVDATGPPPPTTSTTSTPDTAPREDHR